MLPSLHLAEYHVNKETGYTYRYVCTKTERFKFHYHDYFEVFLTICGEARHTVNEITTVIPEGTLVFIRPGDRHLYSMIDNKEYSFANLAFSKEVCDELFAYISDCIDTEELLSERNPPTVRLDQRSKDRLFSLLNSLNAVEFRNIKQHRLMLKSILFEIFTKYFTAYSSNNSETPLWLENALQQIQKPKNFIAGKERFLELCGKSDGHVCRYLKKFQNITPIELINDLRLNYAANMLINTNMPITDICFESGFESTGWFFSAFKKKYFLSPGQYRKKHGRYQPF